MNHHLGFGLAATHSASSRVTRLGRRTNFGTPPGERQWGPDRRAPATFTDVLQGSSDNRATNRVSDQCRTKCLSRGASILYIGVLSLIGWATILASVLVLL
jgi:hypothetical protein